MSGGRSMNNLGFWSIGPGIDDNGSVSREPRVLGDWYNPLIPRRPLNRSPLCLFLPLVHNAHGLSRFPLVAA